nr:SPASM domain-containing protein [Pseudodesulfovibrio sp. JC047]
MWPEKSVAQAAASVLRDHVGDSVWNTPRTGIKIAADPRLWFKAHPDKTPSNVSCTWDCEAARTCIGILTDGRVVPCVPLGRLGVTMGSLREAPLQEIWQSENAMRLRNNVNMEQGECASCDLRFGCRGGCKANVLAATGTFGGPDPDMRGICPL